MKKHFYSLVKGLMGANSSRDDTNSRSFRSTSSSSYSNAYHASDPYHNPYERPPPTPAPGPYHSHQPYSTPYHASDPPTYSNHAPSQSRQPSYAADARRTNRFQRTYSKIADNYQSLEQVTEALSQSGLESSNLIVGIDFTRSNEWTGKRSFNRQSLHHIGDSQNPYEHAISIIGRSLSSFDEDNLIPCFGFGDASTHDQDVFSFYPDGRPCEGFEEALSRYRQIVPHLKLAGPTSFAPIIEMAMTIVEQSAGQYHVLLIIADGQVTRSVNTDAGFLSPQEQKTVDAIVQASHYPLSIVLVGVGDGPWDMMKEFDDNIPSRDFDNFQFVNFTDIIQKNVSQTKKETEFALAALMEIPEQYLATLELGILGHRTGNSLHRVALPTPPVAYGTSGTSQKAPSLSSYHNSTPRYTGYDTRPTTAANTTTSASSWDSQLCSICLANQKNMAFGCGHQTCCDCGQTLGNCPICRSTIVTRIRLY